MVKESSKDDMLLYKQQAFREQKSDTELLNTSVEVSSPRSLEDDLGMSDLESKLSSSTDSKEEKIQLMDSVLMGNRTVSVLKGSK